ncbi:MAG TPA: type II toxin-antitoxin system RelE/ParE family toxin [Gemmataceae bacterium]|nr:type II toxin-antitoxin system RelE/ParE family toxin [Gemmataceae bacterium]
MPKTTVVFFKDDDGDVPLLQWLAELRPKEAVAKRLALIETLRERGHDLRRPQAAPLRDGIYELRARLNKVRLRMLYFFHKKAAVLTHGFGKKSDETPPVEIDRAVNYRTRFLADPKKHFHSED